MTDIYWKKLTDTAIIPKRETEYSAGIDLHADIKEDIEINPGEIKLIGTGLSAEPSQKECALFIFARSGLSTKNGIALANGVGVVDSDYRGEIKVPLINLGKDIFTVKQGMRIAQLVCMPILFTKNIEKNHLEESKRGNGGFGSTGV